MDPGHLVLGRWDGRGHISFVTALKLPQCYDCIDPSWRRSLDRIAPCNSWVAPDQKLSFANITQNFSYLQATEHPDEKGFAG
jgi:hypothetical protein